MPNKTILIVEDDLTLSGVMQSSLQKRQYSVVGVSTIAQAKHALEEMDQSPVKTFDLAIVDLKLAQEHSLSLLPILRAHSSAMKIVMLTGYASIATAVEAVKLGADNYLPKPATITEILLALEELDPQPSGADIHESACDEPEVEFAALSSTLSTRRMEWEHIQRVLHKNDGNISATARELNMHRRTLQRKLQKHPVKD